MNENRIFRGFIINTNIDILGDMYVCNLYIFILFSTEFDFNNLRNKFIRFEPVPALISLSTCMTNN